MGSPGGSGPSLASRARLGDRLWAGSADAPRLRGTRPDSWPVSRLIQEIDPGSLLARKCLWGLRPVAECPRPGPLTQKGVHPALHPRAQDVVERAAQLSHQTAHSQNNFCRARVFPALSPCPSWPPFVMVSSSWAPEATEETPELPLELKIWGELGTEVRNIPTVSFLLHMAT